MILLNWDWKLYAWKKSTFKKKHNRYAIQWEDQASLYGLNPNTVTYGQIYKHISRTKRVQSQLKMRILSFKF